MCIISGKIDSVMTNGICYDDGMMI